MENQLTEFENSRRAPVKAKRVLALYCILLILLVTALVRAWVLWKRIMHH